MREAVLRAFFEGSIDTHGLVEDLEGGTTSSGQVSRYSIVDMEGVFQVEARHLIKVCEAFLEGDLSAEHLKAIGFAILASDWFEWAEDDAEISSRVANEWATPEVNYPIDKENVRKWLHLLISTM